MPKPYAAASLPVGTVLLHDGARYQKWAASNRRPFPWMSETGTPYTDEWATRALNDGAEIEEN